MSMLHTTYTEKHIWRSCFLFVLFLFFLLEWYFLLGYSSNIYFFFTYLCVFFFLFSNFSSFFSFFSFFFSSVKYLRVLFTLASINTVIRSYYIYICFLKCFFYNYILSNYYVCVPTKSRNMDFSGNLRSYISL